MAYCFAEVNEDSDPIRDVIGFVKGGTLGQSAAQLVVRNAETYRSWGKSLKYNPAVIKFEVIFPDFLIHAWMQYKCCVDITAHFNSLACKKMQKFNKSFSFLYIHLNVLIETIPVFFFPKLFT